MVLIDDECRRFGRFSMQDLSSSGSLTIGQISTTVALFANPGIPPILDPISFHCRNEVWRNQMNADRCHLIYYLVKLLL